jgi:hypothetical protein
LSGHAQRFSLVAEYISGSLFDAFPYVFDTFTGPSLNLLCLWKEAASEQLTGCLKSSVNIVSACPAQRIVELFRKQRLGSLRLLAHIFHLVNQLFGTLSLPFDPFRYFAVHAGIRKCLSFRIYLLFYLIGYFFLSLVELLRLVKHIAHLLSKLPGGPALEFVTHLLELALCSRSGSDGP